MSYPMQNFKSLLAFLIFSKKALLLARAWVTSLFSGKQKINQQKEGWAEKWTNRQTDQCIDGQRQKKRQIQRTVSLAWVSNNLAVLFIFSLKT